MERTKESVIFLDTHIVMWLFNSLKNKFSSKIITLMEKGSLKMSPIVMLELEYLYEIKKIKYPAKEIYNSLNWSIDLSQSTNGFTEVIQKANAIKWTRDVFDRIIVADSAVGDNYLITDDRKILKNFNNAIKP